MLPWHVIREDGHGNRYRVGSYATRSEAQRVVDRLGGHGDGERGTGAGAADSYLVEPPGSASGGNA